MTPSRILVVEDNPLNLKLVRDVLQFAGYDVVEAQSGEEGLRAAQTDPPDLVLMDLQLPGIDGIRNAAQVAAGRSRQGRAGRRRHRLRHGRGPTAGIVGRLRRFRREADQCAGVAGAGRGVSDRGTSEAGGHDDGPTRDRAGGRRSADQPAAPRRRPHPPRASGHHHFLWGGSTLVARDRGRRHRPARHPDAGDGRPRSLSQDPGHACDGIPSGRDDHGQRKRTTARRARIGSRRLRHQALRPERAAGPGGVTGPDQAIPRHHPAAGRRARRVERRARDPGRHAARELERTSRLRHFLSPQLADLVVGDEDLLRSHRREIVVVFTDLRNFTPFAEASEPEEVMGVLGEYHRAIGALVHAYNGTLERFTGDGIMVFFNDPVPCDDAAERAVRMSIDIRDEVRKLSAGWLRKGHDLGLGIGIAQGFATLGRIGFEGRSDYSAIGSVTNLAARLCGDAEAWQVLVTDRVLARRRGHDGIGDRRRLAAQGIQPLGAGSQHHGDTRQVGGGMTRVQTAGRPLSGLSEEERYRYFDDLQLTMPTVWESMRLGFDDESVVVVPSISIEGPSGRSGTIMQAMEERALFLLLLLRQPRLRMIYVTSQPVSEAIVQYYLGLLPGVIPSQARARLTLVPVGDASPESLSAKLLARPRLMREIRRHDPQSGQKSPDPVQHHTAREGCRAVPRHPDVRRGSPARGPRQQDRLPQDVRGARRAVPGRRGGSPHGGRDRGGRAEHARATAVADRGDREAQRGRLGFRQRSGGSARAARLRFAGRGGGDQGAAARHAAGVGEADAGGLPGRVRGARRHRRGADHRGRADQSQCPDARAARRHRRTAVHPRSAARRQERSDISRLRVPGGSRHTPRRSPSPRW